ncbi:DUF4396 domain-containing protein [Dactylosporangium roseum]|uniref:DUF4396 domain-containing protein n=1 Tax=Dactylosporangium roseum TaxID=47989 RepID=A0ABY5ZCY7_9ACTN|nr:DUF4396 domain-containing protein [Dactylosporangium roseum]UWZ39737.1 DUF4396 domain-containing protein [Dactylosporangium roseum]
MHPGSAVYRFLMQAGMALGFLTAYPVSIWLIRKGIKEAVRTVPFTSKSRTLGLLPLGRRRPGRG